MFSLAARPGSTKLELERRALLIQLGGYTFNGAEKLYSTEGQAHLEAVTARKERLSRVDGNSLKH